MRCPCCAQEIPESDKFRLLPVGMILSANNKSVRLSKTEFKIMAALQRAAIPMRQLVDRVYDDDPNGGPDDPRNTIAVLQVRLNRKIKALGLRCGGDRRGNSTSLQGIWPCE